MNPLKSHLNKYINRLCLILVLMVVPPPSALGRYRFIESDQTLSDKNHRLKNSDDWLKKQNNNNNRNVCDNILPASPEVPACHPGRSGPELPRCCAGSGWSSGSCHHRYSRSRPPGRPSPLWLPYRLDRGGRWGHVRWGTTEASRTSPPPEEAHDFICFVLTKMIL